VTEAHVLDQFLNSQGIIPYRSIAQIPTEILTGKKLQMEERAKGGRK